MIKYFTIFLLAINLSFSQDRWQQKVEYKIDAFLDVKSHMLDGLQEIVYYNNSPDTLNELFIHLYWNAFKPGSYMHMKSTLVHRDIGDKIAALKPDEQGDVKINMIEIDGKPVQFDIHDTILKLLLDSPIKPHSTLKLKIKFKSQVPKLTRRSGRDSHQGIKYNMAQWYPKICEYDDQGWHNDEYAGREFFGVWGNFDVKITLAANFILGGTGVIQNPNEVKCGYDIGFSDTKWKPSENNKIKDSLKTWHFFAENVHDFAWVADDRYIHDIYFWNDCMIHALYLPDNEGMYANVKYYAFDMLDFFSETYGKYPYKQFTVAEAGDGGMEYPNIVFNASGSSGLVAHEGGHQWFYGLVGNNESREAWLDEGFIDYATQKMQTEKWNQPSVYYPEGLDKFLLAPWDIHYDLRNYWLINKLGIEEPISTHSDVFKDDHVYGITIYQKGSLILPMLEYTIGKPVFDKAMKKYFELWHFKHPKMNDFERVLELESGMKLDWFFDEWIGSTKTCDYSISKTNGKWIEKNGKKKYEFSCDLENKDDIVMPIDLVVTLKNGSQKKFIIPIDWKSKQEPDAIILPRWDWVSKSYSFKFDLDDEVTFAEIDPSHRLADIDQLNNTSGILPKIDFNFISPINLNPPIDSYWIVYKPYVWYNLYDGIKAGFSSLGGYMGNSLNPPEHAIKAGLYYGFKSNQIDFELGYSTYLDALGKMAYLKTSFSKFDGLRDIKISLEKLFEPFHPSFSNEQKIVFEFENSNLVEDDNPFYNSNWEKGNLNTFSLSYQFRSSNNSINIFLNSEFSFNSFNNYDKYSFEIVKNNIISLPLSFRVFSGYSSSMPPIQKAFNLSAASTFEQHRNSIYRNLISLNKNFPQSTNRQLEGDGNLRGYFENYTDLFGKNILAFNFETQPIRIFSKFGIKLYPFNIISTSLFYDIGNIWNFAPNSFKSYLNNFISDAGIKFEVSLFQEQMKIKNIFPILSDFKIIFNIPAYLSDPIRNESKFKWRWNISIGKLIEF